MRFLGWRRGILAKRCALAAVLAITNPAICLMPARYSACVQVPERPQIAGKVPLSLRSNEPRSSSDASPRPEGLAEAAIRRV